MSIMNCSRRGCEQIMCDRYSSTYGCICEDCFKEFKSSPLTAQVFMAAPRTETKCEAEEVFKKEMVMSETKKCMAALPGLMSSLATACDRGMTPVQARATLEQWDAVLRETSEQTGDINRVFLGGTCADTDWRKNLERCLSPDISFFNPVVEDWTDECQAEEEREKLEECNIHLYVVTSEMQGVFSIAEVVESAMTPGKLTIFHVFPRGFTTRQLKSMKAVCKMVTKHGGITYLDEDIQRTARVLNNCFA